MNAPAEMKSSSNELLVSQLEEALRLAREARPPHLHLVERKSSDLVALARTMFRARRRREPLLSSLGFEFGEPAWDLLLDLFISEHERRKISVSSACLAANVPSTTGLRWIALLADRGLIVRENDPTDKRRNHLRLSPTALSAMERYLELEFASRETDSPRAQCSTSTARA